jgi:hypothetical protein
MPQPPSAIWSGAPTGWGNACHSRRSGFLGRTLAVKPGELQRNKNQTLPNGTARVMNQLLGLAAVIAASGAAASANAAE